MSDAISVKITAQDRPYKIGDKVHGHVELFAGDVASCRSLYVRLMHEHKDAIFGSECARIELMRGDITPGDHRYDFEIVIPEGAPTSSIANGEIRWRVEVCADLAWASDPSDVAQLRVSERPASDALVADNGLTAFDVVCSAAGVGLVALGAWLWLNSPVAGIKDSEFAAFAAAALGVIGLVVGMLRVWQRLVWGLVRLEVSPGTTHAGGQLLCVVTCQPLLPLTLSQAVFHIKSSLVTEVGDNVSADVTAQRVETVGQGQRLARGARLEVMLPVPKEGGATFYTDSRRRVWEVIVTLRASGRPACKLEVLPTIT